MMSSHSGWKEKTHHSGWKEKTQCSATFLSPFFPPLLKTHRLQNRTLLVTSPLKMSEPRLLPSLLHTPCFPKLTRPSLKACNLSPSFSDKPAISSDFERNVAAECGPPARKTSTSWNSFFFCKNKNGTHCMLNASRQEAAIAEVLCSRRRCLHVDSTEPGFTRGAGPLAEGGLVALSDKHAAGLIALYPAQFANLLPETVLLQQSEEFGDEFPGFSPYAARSMRTIDLCGREDPAALSLSSCATVLCLDPDKFFEPRTPTKVLVSGVHSWRDALEGSPNLVSTDEGWLSGSQRGRSEDLEGSGSVESTDTMVNTPELTSPMEHQ